VLATLDDESTRRELLMGLSASVEEVTSEVWQYRSELSLIPANPAPTTTAK
jgi:hypothetical protein